MPSVANTAARTELFNAPRQIVKGEPVALSGIAASSLVYPVRRILSVYRFDPTTGARVEYATSDYALEGSKIVRTGASAIYDFGAYTITMTAGKYALVATAPRNPPIVMNLLAYVDYETDYLMPVIIPALAAAPVGGLIIAAGDSITGGAHTIRREFAPLSDGDGYVGLLRSHLHKKASFYNFSFDGSYIGQLTSSLSSLLAMNPSILTVAFGQNDHVGGSSALAAFQSALTDIVTNCQSAGVRVILVGFMPKNPLWVNFSLADCISYNNGIAAVAAAKGVPFVDIHARWAAMRTRKAFIELTGDNHHHPNNYGSRIWFSAVLPYLLHTPISSVGVPEYVALP